MGVANRKLRLFTEEQYLDFDDEALEKSEFFQGKIYAMAGGSYDHAAISSNIGGELRTLLKGKKCQVSSSDTRVKIPNSSLNTYPDVTVICGKPELHLYKNTQTLLNPTLIVEVLSPTTENYDQGDKFENYKLIPSLSDYILVAQERARVEHFVRQADDSWSCTVSEGLGSIVKIESLECELPLAEIYLKVDLK